MSKKITSETRRHVYRPNEIPHLWAHGLPPGFEIRNPSRNFYAIGDTIYSYAGHFPIAQRVELPDNRTAYLFTTRRYSTTTAKHIHSVRLAMRGNGQVFHIDPFDPADNELWTILSRSPRATAKQLRPVAEWYQQLIDIAAANAAAKKIGAGTRAKYIAEARGWLAEWQRLHECFRLRITINAVKLPKVIAEVEAKYAQVMAEYPAKLEAKRAAARERGRIKYEKCERLRRERMEALAKYRPALIDQFRASGEGSIQTDEYGRISLRNAVDYPVLRIERAEKAGIVRTSHGVAVPLDDARRAFDLLPRLVAKMNCNGITDDTVQLGHYSGLSVNRNGVRIGCHNIPWQEIRDFATYAGWPVPGELLPL